MRTATAQPEPDPIACLDCGHPESAHSAITRGYATTPEGTRICYSCAEKRDRANLLEADHYTAYLTEGADHRLTLTAWPGWTLATVTASWETSAGGWARRTNIVRFRAVDVHGQHWYGTSPGVGMYARMHKAKGKR